uniref:Uncharacterized protein n=1 Tax=Erythrolobus australicus TaxID=1077150 RepID=A0A7S1TL08_9RHOD|mmetsp:Transcript_1830/g.4853  ORF Transcript_1830/g.4853 Transcript_1830/m.4853 type:complete len:211 (+) Transcript_1830:108-740(+)
MSGGDSSGELERQLNSAFDDIFAARQSLIKEYEQIICHRFQDVSRSYAKSTVTAMSGILPYILVTPECFLVGLALQYFVPAQTGGTGLSRTEIELLASAAQCEARAFKTLEHLLLTIRQESLSRTTSSKLRVLKPVLGLGEPIANAGYDEAVTKLGGPVVSSGMAAFTMHEFILISNQRHIEKPTAKLCEIFVAAKDGLQGQLDSWLRFG